MISVLVVSFLLLLVLGVPLAFSMIAACTLFIMSHPTLPYEVIPQQVFRGLDHFTWLAIPLFMLAGELMNKGGITVRLVNCVQAFVGHLAGGLAYVSVVTNVVMAGISVSTAVQNPATRRRKIRPGDDGRRHGARAHHRAGVCHGALAPWGQIDAI